MQNNKKRRLSLNGRLFLSLIAVKYILMVLYIIDCLGLIIVTMMQNSDSRGASGTIVGSSSNNFYEKNKGRTREGKLKRWTIILGVAFVVLAVALGIVYVIK